MPRRSILPLFSLTFFAAIPFAACGDGTHDAEPHPDAGVVSDDGGEPDPNDIEKFINACAKVETATNKAPAYLEFVLDGSKSMLDNGKWKAAVEALDTVFDEMHTQADPKIAAGLLVYEDKNANACPLGSTCKYPSPLDVAPSFVDDTQLSALRKRVDQTAPEGVTPTYAALDAAYKVLTAYVPGPPLLSEGRRIVVLMSDGKPTDDTPGAIKLAKKYAAEPTPIKTFSIGIGPFPAGDGYDPSFMSNLAIAGGTRATPSCNPDATDVAELCHFQLTPGADQAALKADFYATLNRIRGIALGCEYLLEKTGDFDAAQTNVIFTTGAGKKKLIPKDPNNGWSFDDEANPERLLLHGQACGDASGDLESSIKIIIGCKSK